MSLFQKKQQEEQEPQYYTSMTNIKTLNYKVYYMSDLEKVLYFLAAFAVGAACGYLFYGGIGKDEFGSPTTVTYVLNITISVIVGSVSGKLFLPIRVQQIINKRQRMIKRQFRDMLECLSTSLSSGKNVTDAFLSVQQDLAMQYDEDAFIHNELKVIVSGIRNNQDIEVLLYDFGRRTGIKDIIMFASIFRISLFRIYA